MVQRGQRAGLTFEPLLEIRISGDILGQDCDGDSLVQAGVGGLAPRLVPPEPAGAPVLSPHESIDAPQDAGSRLPIQRQVTMAVVVPNQLNHSKRRATLRPLLRS